MFVHEGLPKSSYFCSLESEVAYAGTPEVISLSLCLPWMHPGTDLLKVFSVFDFSEQKHMFDGVNLEESKFLHYRKIGVRKALSLLLLPSLTQQQLTGFLWNE
jgi:hypothetical protein